MHQLPKQIIYNNKIFREAGFSYANSKGYKHDNERILVEPNGTVWFHYFMEENYAREM